MDRCGAKKALSSIKMRTSPFVVVLVVSLISVIDVLLVPHLRYAAS
jgi:hypothetical protein